MAQAPTTEQMPDPSPLRRAARAHQRASRALTQELARFEEALAARGIELDLTDEPHGADGAKEN